MIRRDEGKITQSSQVLAALALVLVCMYAGVRHTKSSASLQDATESENSSAGARHSAPGVRYPQLVDITASTGIHFDHVTSAEQKYIVESMSGGVALIDYDRDGWPDIYFTNALWEQMTCLSKAL